MNKLIIIAGASGAGKSFLMQEMSKIGDKITPIIKMSTRSAREHEKNSKYHVDIKFDCSIEDIKKKCQFKYKYENEIYGIEKEHIDEALKKGETPFVIVRDCMEIKRIKSVYTNRCIAIYLHNAFSGEELKNKLMELGRSDIDSTIRNQRLRYDCINYQQSIPLFDAVLINDFLDDSIIKQLKDVINYQNEIDPRIKDKVFVLMPINCEMNNYYTAIRWQINRFNKNNKKNLSVIRVDDEMGRHNISNTIIQHINEAELIICDLTNERPNVYYELGYATALNREVLLIAKENTKIHFDISNDYVNFYKNYEELGNIISQYLVLEYKKKYGCI